MKNDGDDELEEKHSPKRMKLASPKKRTKMEK